MPSTTHILFPPSTYTDLHLSSLVILHHPLKHSCPTYTRVFPIHLIPINSSTCSSPTRSRTLHSKVSKQLSFEVIRWQYTSCTIYRMTSRYTHRLCTSIACLSIHHQCCLYNRRVSCFKSFLFTWHICYVQQMDLIPTHKTIHSSHLSHTFTMNPEITWSF
jgi:hypothetical protein